MSSYGSERGATRAGAQAADQRTAPARSGYEPYVYEDTGFGSTAVAASLLILGGLLEFLMGLAVVIRASYFKSLATYSSTVTNYAYHWNISNWGWLNFSLGILVVLVGVSVLLGQTWARWAGVVVAIMSAISSFLWLPFYPIWSIIVIAVDVFIIWALATARQRRDLGSSV